MILMADSDTTSRIASYQEGHHSNCEPQAKYSIQSGQLVLGRSPNSTGDYFLGCS